MSPLQITRVALSLAALACLSASLYFMYQAGFAGDLKTGALGDPRRALNIESTGVLFAWLSIGFVAVAVSVHTGLVVIRRIATVICTVVLSLSVFTYLGISAEVRGTQNCFAKK
jgi:hypothetical protein